MSIHHDHPGVIAPPPLIFGIGIVVGFPLNALIPLPFAADSWRWMSVVLMGVGVALGLWTVWVMYRRNTSPLPERPTTALVIEGPFRFSRNPIYLGFTLITLGVAGLANSLWVALLLVPVHLVIHYGVVLREERYLTSKFGEEYIRYRARVRRWL
jgi:protein-S-isoprenylcysteine O-methyltransferase Ste14